MSWKTIVINKYDKVALKNNLLLIKNQSRNLNISFPITDVNCIILENNYTILSTQVLSKLVENNVFLIICDEKYEPNGIIMSFHNHWRPLEIFEKQISLESNHKQSLWKKIIENKIQNSINVMKMLSCSERSIEMMSNFYKTVKLNDITNREALSAKVFFRELYGSSFIRFSEDIINSALNYGYTIIAAAISRTLVKYGIHCFLGIFHKGKTNNWNLSYDLVEPYRPLIDLWISNNLESLLQSKTLDYYHRLELINILNQYVIIDEKMNTITNSIEVMVKSYVTFLKTKSLAKFKLPTIVYFEERDSIEERDSRNDEEE